MDEEYREMIVSLLEFEIADHEFSRDTCYEKLTEGYSEVPAALTEGFVGKIIDGIKKLIKKFLNFLKKIWNWFKGLFGDGSSGGGGSSSDGETKKEDIEIAGKKAEEISEKVEKNKKEDGAQATATEKEVDDDIKESMPKNKVVEDIIEEKEKVRKADEEMTRVFNEGGNVEKETSADPTSNKKTSFTQKVKKAATNVSKKMSDKYDYSNYHSEPSTSGTTGQYTPPHNDTKPKVDEVIVDTDIDEVEQAERDAAARVADAKRRADEVERDMMDRVNKKQEELNRTNEEELKKIRKAQRDIKINDLHNEVWSKYKKYENELKENMDEYRKDRAKINEKYSKDLEMMKNGKEYSFKGIIGLPVEEEGCKYELKGMNETLLKEILDYIDINNTDEDSIYNTIKENNRILDNIINGNNSETEFLKLVEDFGYSMGVLNNTIRSIDRLKNVELTVYHKMGYRFKLKPDFDSYQFEMLVKYMDTTMSKYAKSLDVIERLPYINKNDNGRGTPMSTLRESVASFINCCARYLFTIKTLVENSRNMIRVINDWDADAYSEYKKASEAKLKAELDIMKKAFFTKRRLLVKMQEELVYTYGKTFLRDEYRTIVNGSRGFRQFTPTSSTPQYQSVDELFK